MPYRRLDAAKTELVRRFFSSARAENESLWDRRSCARLIDGPPARIAEPHHFGDLIVRLAGSVVASTAEMIVVADVAHAIEQRVPAGSEQRDIRKATSCSR